MLEKGTTKDKLGRTYEKRYHAELSKSNFMRSEEESMSLYEQWRLNPHISVQTQNKNIKLNF
jgi:hypothetical protein